MLVKVDTAMNTTSWTLESFTGEELYSIDKLTSGLTLEYQCNFPCLSCDPATPDICESCNLINNYQILYENVCYDRCPAGTFYEGYACKPCLEPCLECTYLSGTWCTKCDPDSVWPYLDGNTCTDTCGFGEYGLTTETTSQCETCNYPCTSCDGTADTCTSCDIGNLEKHYHAVTNQCLTECPGGYVVNKESGIFECIPCSPNCVLCTGTPDTCASCSSDTILNELDASCVEECPPDITVYDTSSGQPTCRPCDSSCLTCSGAFDFCTSCTDNMSLQEDTGKCLLDCDTENNLEVAVDGICVPCSDNCKTCQLTPDSCLTCEEGFLFHSNKCLTECPFLNGYQFTDNGEGICTIPGLICPFGYKHTPNGEACEINLKACIHPNTLNYDGDGCVPGSEDYILFPILGVCLVLTLLVAISKWISRPTRFVANLIVFWSFMEIICMVAIFYFAYKFGIKPVVYLILASIVLHYMINFFFSLVFNYQVKQDKTFRHWCTYHTCGVTMITFFATVFNFKIFRLLYSRLFGRDDFNAPFDDPYMFFRPYNLISIINMFTVKVLCLIAAIFTTIYVPWGYQLFIVAIELIVIEVVLLICYITEYCMWRNTLMKEPDYQ